jgi:predicted small lipoprotein YifL
MAMRATPGGFLILLAFLGLAACEKQGPVERAGEEVDEAVDTMKRGGEESAETRADDAADEAREAADELKKDE